MGKCLGSILQSPVMESTDTNDCTTTDGAALANNNKKSVEPSKIISKFNERVSFSVKGGEEGVLFTLDN